MIMGAMILLGALLLWTLGFEIYSRNAKVSGVINDEVELVTLTLDNTVAYIDTTENESCTYSLTRSGNFEWKMYGKELRITARGGVLDLKIPRELETLDITNTGAETNVFMLDADEVRIVTDSHLNLSNVDADRSKLDVASLNMTSSEIDRLFITATGKVDITETDSDDISLFFKDLDASILGGKIGYVDAASSEGCLEIESENGISSISVTGGASTIFIEGEDTSSKSYLDDANPEGTQIKFTSPKGSVKAC